MIDALKKTVMAGLGAAVVSKERVQQGLEELVQQGKISAADAVAAAEKIAEQGRREFDEASSRVGASLKDLLSRVDDRYEKRIESLESRVAALEAKAPKKAGRGGGSATGAA